MLVFFLVDPTERIFSTLHIPPQDRRWFYQDVALAGLQDARFQELFWNLPTELREKIREEYGGLGLRVAKKHRLALMRERSSKNSYFIDEVTTQACNFCEH